MAVPVYSTPLIPNINNEIFNAVTATLYEVRLLEYSHSIASISESQLFIEISLIEYNVGDRPRPMTICTGCL